jgi:hypothetical protein
MELIGLIVKKYNNISWNEPIIFNSNYTIEWRNQHLKVNKVEDSVLNFYGDSISNITAIVGNNGVGKTTILDLIGCTKEERKYHAFDSSYCLIFWNSNVLLEMFNFDIESIEINSHIEQINKLKYTGIYNLCAVEDDQIDNMYYFQSSKVLRGYEDYNGLIRRRYGNSKQFSLKDAKSKFDAYKLLVDKRFISNSSNYKWEIRINTFEETLNDLTDYCFRKVLPLDWNPEYDFKDFISKCVFGDSIYHTNDGENNLYCKNFLYLNDTIQELVELHGIATQRNYNNIDEALKDEEFQKRFKRLSIEFKRFVVFNRFGFIFQNFFGRVSFEEFLEKGLALSFNELQILNVLVDTYMYIRDLYFPNYNKAPNADDIVANWEILFKDITIFFTQLLEKDFVREDDGEFVGEGLPYDNCRDLGVEPSNDIVEYINFTARFLREFYQVNDNLKSIDDQSCVVKIDFEDQSVKDFIDELRTTIDFTEKRKIDLINERGEAIWFQVREVTSKGEKNLLDLVAMIKTRSFEGNYIILVDEIEEGLHLEWSRRLINFLINEFNKVSNSKIQFIFTTHSPFMLSDIKNGNVICLVKDEEDVKVELMRNTFAKNIQEIMHDDMFIKDIYGEFAISKINNIIKELDPHQDINSHVNYLTKENLLSEIDMISEPLLRNKLYEMYEKKFQESTIENRIKQLKSELEKLEAEKSNNFLN